MTEATQDPQDPKVDPNSADLQQLTSLPGVGETLAARIQAARPYRDMEELSRVSGLGSKGLERIAPYLTFDVEVQAEPPAEAEAEAERESTPGDASEPTEVAPAQPPADRRGGVSAFVQILATSVLTGLLSVGLTLGILLAINGTLNMGRHSQVKELNETTADLAEDTEALERRLAGIDERLAALEGLTGRMSAVEEEVGSLQAEVDAAVEDVTRMQDTVRRVERSVRLLSSRADRFDAFLDGLRDLLLDPEAEQDSTDSGSGNEGP